MRLEGYSLSSLVFFFLFSIMLNVPSIIKNKAQSLKPATPFSNAIDLSAHIEQDLELEEDCVNIIPTGLYLDMLDPELTSSLKEDEQLCALVLPRSGLASKYGITVANTPGLIDSDYQGEVKVALVRQSFSNLDFGQVKTVIKPNERIAQLLFIVAKKVVLKPVESFKNKTERGEGGFGSTSI